MSKEIAKFVCLKKVVMDNEIWKDIPGYEGEYQVSNFGRLYSSRYNRFIATAINKSGYVIVALHHKSLRVHRLVAMAFLPNPNNYPQINHKDEVKTNNYVDNLEWCTAKYNVNYGTRNKRASISRINQKRRSFPINATSITDGSMLFFPSINEAMRNGFYKKAIKDCCRGDKKQYRGYMWSYASK